MVTELTYDQWLLAVEEAKAKASSDGDGALTAPEWTSRCGCSRETMNKWINAGLKNGWLETVRVLRVDRVGVTRPQPAYRLVKRVTEGRRLRRAKGD